MSTTGSVKIFSGNANPKLAEEICRQLSCDMGKAYAERFSDGEFNFQIDENVRGGDVFIVQPTCPPTDAHLMELLVMIDAFRRSSAERITAVLPYYGYGRSDKKDRPRVPISAKLVANLITVAGAHRVLTIDLHAAQIQGFFDIPVDHLYAAPVMYEYLRSKKLKNLVVVSPDVGGLKMAHAYSQVLEAGLAIVAKRSVAEEINLEMFSPTTGGRKPSEIVLFLSTDSGATWSSPQLLNLPDSDVLSSHASMIDLDDGRHLDAGPAHEDLVGDVLVRDVLRGHAEGPPLRQITEADVAVQKEVRILARSGIEAVVRQLRVDELERHATRQVGSVKQRGEPRAHERNREKRPPDCRREARVPLRRLREGPAGEIAAGVVVPVRIGSVREARTDGKVEVLGVVEAERSTQPQPVRRQPGEVGFDASGAQLGGCMVTTDWRQENLPAGIIKGAVLCSGMYDLHPVSLSARSSPPRPALPRRMDSASARAGLRSGCDHGAVLWMQAWRSP